MKVWMAKEGQNVYDNKLPGEITNIYNDGFGVKVANGEVIFTEIQLEGKSKTDAKNFINGHSDLIGKLLK